MRTLIVLLAASMTLVGLPVAAADEGHPDCEEDQPLIGYKSTLFLRDILMNPPVVGGTTGPLDDDVYVCEGEHWDGQDTVQPDKTATCNPSVSAVPTDLFLAVCQGSDINQPPQPTADYLGVRVGSKNLNEVYSSVNIGAVGSAAVYAGPGTVAVHVRDNTANNQLAQIVSALRITQGYPSENDCDQETYQNGAMNPPSQCGRDNTAITVHYGIPTLP